MPEVVPVARRTGRLVLPYVTPAAGLNRLLLDIPIAPEEASGAPVGLTVTVSQSADGVRWWPMGGTGCFTPRRFAAGVPWRNGTTRFGMRLALTDQIFRRDAFRNLAYDRFGGYSRELINLTDGSVYYHLALCGLIRLEVDVFRHNGDGVRTGDGSLAFGVNAALSLVETALPKIGRRSASLIATFTAAESATIPSTTGSRTTTSGTTIFGQGGLWDPLASDVGTMNITDSKSNAYDEIMQKISGPANAGVVLGRNLAGTRGTSHTVSSTTTNGGCASSAGAHEWDGIQTTTPATATNNENDGATASPAISVTTPATAGTYCVIAVMGYSGSGLTVAPAGGATEAQETDETSDQMCSFTAYKVGQTNSTSVAIAWSVSGGVPADTFMATLAIQEGATATYEQEGFRFRRDDGSETTATWLDTQDDSIARHTGVNTRLRTIVKAGGGVDPPSQTYGLWYRLSTDSVDRLVQTAGGGALATGTAGTVGSGGTTSVTVAYPAGIVAGDLILMWVGNRPNAQTPADIAGWDKFSATGGTGAEGAGTGTTRGTLYVKKDADGRYEAAGTETGSVTVTCTSGTSMFGRMVKYSKTTGKAWAVAHDTGNDSSAGAAGSWTCATNIGLSAGDMLAIFIINSEDTARAASEAVTATGCTFGSLTEIQDSGITTGNDLGMVICDFPVSTGPSSAAPVCTLTWSGTNSANSAGPARFVRIRQVDQPIQLSASANITASGEATTALLTPPNTGNFRAGRLMDDENPSDAIDLAADEYTELEWCLTATSNATLGAAYQFRVKIGAAGTALDTYTVVPSWSIGFAGAGAGTTAPVTASVAGTFTAGAGGHNAAAVCTIAPAAASAAGEFDAPTFSGAAVCTVGAATTAAAAYHYSPNGATVRVRNFNVTTSIAGTKIDITNLGFNLETTPWVAIFKWSGRTAAGQGEEVIQGGIGFLKSGGDSGCAAWSVDHGNANGVSHNGNFDDCCVCAVNTAADSVDGKLTYDSVAGTRLRLNVSDAFSRDLSVSVIVIGKSTIESYIGVGTVATAAGNQDVTAPNLALNTGENDKAVLFATGDGFVDLNDTDTWAMGCIGIAANDTPVNVATLFRSEGDGPATTNTARWGASGRCFYITFGGTLLAASVSAWLSTGFRLNWHNTTGAASHNFIYMVIKGVDLTLLETATRTDTNTWDVTGAGFEPAGALLLSACATESTVSGGDDSVADAMVSVGFVDEELGQAAHGYFDRDNSAAVDCATAVRHDGVYVRNSTANPSVLDAVGEVDSILSDGLRLQMADADSAASWLAVLMVGPRTDVVTFSGVATCTIGAVTAAAEGTFAPGTKTAAAAITITAVTAALTGTFTAPTYDGDVASTIAPVTASGSATFTVPTYDGDAAATTAPVTAAVVGTFVPPTYDGDVASTIAPVTAAAVATFAVHTYDGDVASTIAPVTASGSATFTTPTYDGDIASTIAPVTAAVVGTFTKPTYDGDVVATIAAVTASGSATFANAIYDGDIASTIAPVTAAAVATFTVPTYDGDVAATIAPVTATLAGTFTKPTYDGDIASTISPVTAAGTAIFASGVFTGIVTATLAPVTGSGSATFTVPTYDGDIASTIAPVTASVAATFTKPTYDGDVASTIAPVTAAAVATFAVHTYDGDVASTIGAATASAAGTFAPGTKTASAALTIAPATASVSATFTGGGVLYSRALIGLFVGMGS